MKIYLLTHERELDRPTNTGSIALSIAGGDGGLVQRVIWSRTSPSQPLLSVLESGDSGLLYPQSEIAGPEVSLEQCEHFVLLDATWQEARKMYNRSPYLHPLKRVALNVTETSRYTLRRNQRQGGLCTAECVIEILRQKGQGALAAEMESEFAAFNAGLVEGRH
ncbi:DTW domain-containing protein [Microbulbifer elongatus]|uniref:DTW domain-containing protein n=1 Tax=Microbulbifer elongatus TaxID=86173 RepID=UPI001CFE99DC|nr:tRNA-uridine aminocarboxypropyltransferase [Microbulbifer elongatus]